MTEAELAAITARAQRRRSAKDGPRLAQAQAKLVLLVHGPYDIDKLLTEVQRLRCHPNEPSISTEAD